MTDCCQQHYENWVPIITPVNTWLGDSVQSFVWRPLRIIQCAMKWKKHYALPKKYTSVLFICSTSTRRYRKAIENSPLTTSLKNIYGTGTPALYSWSWEKCLPNCIITKSLKTGNPIVTELAQDIGKSHRRQDNKLPNVGFVMSGMLENWLPSRKAETLANQHCFCTFHISHGIESLIRDNLKTTASSIKLGKPITFSASDFSVLRSKMSPEIFSSYCNHQFLKRNQFVVQLHYLWALHSYRPWIIAQYMSAKQWFIIRPNATSFEDQTQIELHGGIQWTRRSKPAASLG